MNFGKHVKRKALYCCSVSVVGLLIACLIASPWAWVLSMCISKRKPTQRRPRERLRKRPPRRARLSKTARRNRRHKPSRRRRRSRWTAFPQSRAAHDHNAGLHAKRRFAGRRAVSNRHFRSRRIYRIIRARRHHDRPHDRIQRRCTDLFGLVGGGAIPDIAVLNGHRRPEQRGPIR